MPSFDYTLCFYILALLNSQDIYSTEFMASVLRDKEQGVQVLFKTHLKQQNYKTVIHYHNPPVDIDQNTQETNFSLKSEERKDLFKTMSYNVEILKMNLV